MQSHSGALNPFADLKAMVERSVGDLGGADLGIRRILGDSNFDVSLGVCYALAREHRRDATDLARGLACALDGERGCRAKNERGLVHIRLPDEWLSAPDNWAPPAARFPERMSILLQLPEGGCPEGLGEAGRMRFVTHALMQGLLWCAHQRWSGAKELSAAEITLSAGTSSWSRFKDLTSAVAVLRRLAANEDSELASLAAASPSAHNLQGEFLWVAEDFRQRREVVSAAGPARIIGCDRLRLLDVPAEQDTAVNEFTLDQWRSYFLYAVFPDPGREFMPSACSLGSYEDVYQRINHLCVRIERVLAPLQSSGDEQARGLWERGLGKDQALRSVLIDARMYRMMSERAAALGAVQEWGSLTLQLLRGAERALGMRPERASGDPSLVALHSYVFSCIYQALTDMLTVVR